MKLIKLISLSMICTLTGCANPGYYAESRSGGAYYSQPRYVGSFYYPQLPSGYYSTTNYYYESGAHRNVYPVGQYGPYWPQSGSYYGNTYDGYYGYWQVR